MVGSPLSWKLFSPMPLKPLVHRLLTVVPALVAMVVLVLALFGHDGVFRRHILQRQLTQVEQESASLKLENQRLRREVRRIQQSAMGLQRVAAESLLIAPPGAVIYRFHEPGAPAEH